eukprot:2067568-Heterocapsa_arctica.AAC.2
MEAWQTFTGIFLYRAMNHNLNFPNRVETRNDLSYAEHGQKHCSKDKEATHNGGDNRHMRMHHCIYAMINTPQYIDNEQADVDRNEKKHLNMTPDISDK